ncbi:hypothetical protein QP888_00660 [Corynebacterium sp. MSK297]|uniref:hypothetical protein n=1 Tax=Corynebacterium sp. MSK297 TaxID=3050221 RepID=UPI002550F37D|nr:hypothetical protein [Corynebacterium sp. MSK297]MDK8845043.1 hypothetical protein [Corynebacterium sp. MSK297]
MAPTQQPSERCSPQIRWRPVLVVHVYSAAGRAGSVGGGHTEIGTAVGIGNADVDVVGDGDDECAA